MKQLFALFVLSLCTLAVQAQEFNKQLASARTAYASGKLDDARFAMQQLLQQLDIMTGKEVLKLLPAKMQEQPAQTAADNVSGASGFAGVIIHREYGTAENKKINLEVISNSPMIASINSILSLPLIGNSGDSKVIRVGGYKALVQKSTGDNDAVNYDVQLPINSSLITLRAPGYTEDQVVKMANTLPIAEIAKLLQ